MDTDLALVSGLSGNRSRISGRRSSLPAMAAADEEVSSTSIVGVWTLESLDHTNNPEIKDTENNGGLQTHESSLFCVPKEEVEGFPKKKG